MKRMAVFLFFAVILIGVVLTMGANLIALDPSEIEKPNLVIEQPPVQLASLPDLEPPPLPEPVAVTHSALAELAPESFNSSMSELAGVGFGAGGRGPAIAGSGGFGESAGSIVGQRGKVDRPPKVVLKTPPEYPLAARSRNIGGFVELRILVSAGGAIESIKVAKSEPEGFFDSAALSAVKRWRFEPAIQAGRAVAAWTQQRIKFELN